MYISRESEKGATLGSSPLGSEQLVLDVINENKIVLAPKAQHKISQLWRMNADGNLVQFSPSSNTDTRRGRSNSNSSAQKLVLDIDVVMTEKSLEMIRKLVLRPLDASRAKTQTWFFEAKTLKCCLSGYAVQGQQGLKSNSVAVLTEYTPQTFGSQYAVGRHKLRPGSGTLSVRVYAVGPTQVVEVSDSQQDHDGEDVADGTALESVDVAKRKRPTTEVLC